MMMFLFNLLRYGLPFWRASRATKRFTQNFSIEELERIESYLGSYHFRPSGDHEADLERAYRAITGGRNGPEVA